MVEWVEVWEMGEKCHGFPLGGNILPLIGLPLFEANRWNYSIADFSSQTWLFLCFRLKLQVLGVVRTG